MSDFVFSIYVGRMKKAWKGVISDMDLISLLYGLIAIPAKLEDKNGEIISCSKTTASEIMNRKTNAHRKIREHSRDEAVMSSIVSAVEKEIVKRLHPGMTDGLIQDLCRDISHSDIQHQRRRELFAFAKLETLADFLSEAYLESLIPDNRLNDSQIEEATEDPEDYKKHPLEQISISTEVTKLEQPYVYALLKAYGDAERGKEITIEMLDSYPKYKKHFQRQRDDYFAAEAVRRGTRDFYSENDPDQFQVLKDEIYDGIIDIYEEDWDNGLIRVRNVMAQASKVAVARCWLSRDTDWIGNAQKKGVCHILVNDGRLRGWRSEDV